MNELLKFAPDDENVPISTGRLKGIEYDIAVTGRPDAVRKEIAFTVRLQRLSSGGLDDNDDNTQVRSHSQDLRFGSLTSVSTGCTIKLTLLIS